MFVEKALNGHMDNISSNEFNLLESAVKMLELELSHNQVQQLLDYKNLLLKWNKVYNLTNLTDPKLMLTHNLLDGLSVIPYFAGSNSILDVGSGMGIPGVVLAVVYPDIAVTMVDSNTKKTAFLLQVKIELGLNNIRVINSRVENLNVDNLFDVITSRAFANLELFVKLTRHLLKPSGVYLAMKGEQGLYELKELPSWKSQVIDITVPDLDAKRFLIKMSRE